MRPALFLLLALFASNAIPAEVYPQKPVRIIVTAGPGSLVDLRARGIAETLSPALGQPVIVEGRVGAGGTIAADYVARSPADGYTIMLVHIGTLVGPALYASANYDPVRDFAPITRISQGAAMLAVNAQLPVHSVADLIRLAREKPGRLNWASTGMGTPPWLLGALFARMANIDVTHVPYKSGGEVITDLVGGRIDYWIESALIQMPQVATGKLRAIAVTGPTRMAAYPDVPTVGESGLPGYEFLGWTGFVAPAGTPRPIIDRLNAELVKVLRAPDTVRWFAETSSEPAPQTPDEFAAFLKLEHAKWTQVVRDSGIKPQ